MGRDGRNARSHGRHWCTTQASSSAIILRRARVVSVRSGAAASCSAPPVRLRRSSPCLRGLRPPRCASTPHPLPPSPFRFRPRPAAPLARRSKNPTIKIKECRSDGPAWPLCGDRCALRFAASADRRPNMARRMQGEVPLTKIEEGRGFPAAEGIASHSSGRRGRFFTHSEGGRWDPIDIEAHRAAFGCSECANAKIPHPETGDAPGPKQRTDAVHGITCIARYRRWQDVCSSVRFASVPLFPAVRSVSAASFPLCPWRRARGVLRVVRRKALAPPGPRVPEHKKVCDYPSDGSTRRLCGGRRALYHAADRWWPPVAPLRATSTRRRRRRANESRRARGPRSDTGVPTTISRAL